MAIAHATEAMKPLMLSSSVTGGRGAAPHHASYLAHAGGAKELDNWASSACRGIGRPRGEASVARMVAPDHLLRIVHAPLRGPEATPLEMRRALELGACSIGWTEAYRRVGFLRRRLMWRTAVGESPTSLRGPGDVPVMVRRHHRPVDRWAIKACDAAHPLRLAHERWLTGFAYQHPLGLIEHIAAHTDPIQAPTATLSMRRAYRTNMERLETVVTVSLELGRLPVVTGDLNLGSSSPLEFAPRHVFDRLNLKVWSVGVDWVAWHRSLIPVRRRVIAPDVNGQDHPWLVIDFEGWRR